jgi:hypothetical protein
MFSMPKSEVGVLIYGLIWWMAIAVAILAFIKVSQYLIF